MDTTETAKRNDGYNAKRIREILGLKQEDLAERLGLSQRSVSKLEATAILKDEQLEAIAKALNVPVEAIKNFSEDKTLNVIVNTMQDNSTINNYPTINHPIEKIVQLYDEKVKLYERLLETEKDKVRLLEEVLKERK